MPLFTEFFSRYKEVPIEYNYCHLPIFSSSSYIFLNTYLYPRVDLDSVQSYPNNLCQQ